MSRIVVIGLGSFLAQPQLLDSSGHGRIRQGCNAFFDQHVFVQFCSISRMFLFVSADARAFPRFRIPTCKRSVWLLSFPRGAPNKSSAMHGIARGAAAKRRAHIQARMSQERESVFGCASQEIRVLGGWE